VIFENKQFPADQAQRPLMELASQREGEKRLKKAPRATTQSATQAARQSASQPGRFPAGSARNFRHGRHELGASQPASMPSTNPR
jgi:hypothetical protein